MNVNLIQMDPDQAKVKLAAYRQQLKRRANQEYELAAKAYEMMTEGYPLLNLTEVFAQTGLGEDGRPRLAIARADREEVEVSVNPRVEQIIFSSLKRSSWFDYGDYVGSLLVRVPYYLAPGAKLIRGFALVPMIPADVRATVKGQDKDHFVLWEVEQWADRSQTSIAPYDPYLIKHVAGDLYAVVAEWDLTELERAIMAERNRGGR
jgi:hypothetical protein